MDGGAPKFSFFDFVLTPACPYNPLLFPGTVARNTLVTLPAPVLGTSSPLSPRGWLGALAPTWCRGRGPSAVPPLLLGWRGIGAGLMTRGCSRRATPARGRSPRRLRDARLVVFCQRSLPFSCWSCPHPPSSRLTGHLSVRCDWDLEAAGGLDGTVPGGERGGGSCRQHRAARTLQPQPGEY